MFFTVEISTVDGTTSQAIFQRADKNTAIGAFHQFLASCVANTKCTHAYCQVLCDNGEIFKTEEYTKSV